jgi:choline dehydrogenase-like flavoprotein
MGRIPVSLLTLPLTPSLLYVAAFLLAGVQCFFVSDGSQFTTGAAENPTLTIVTLAIRQADYIVEQMQKRTI